MRRILAALIFMLIGAGGMYAAFEFHVVQSREGWLFIPKSQVGLDDTYADIRKWQATTWKSHPKLAQSLIDNGRGNLIMQSAFEWIFRQPVSAACKKTFSRKRGDIHQALLRHATLSFNTINVQRDIPTHRETTIVPQS